MTNILNIESNELIINGPEMINEKIQHLTNLEALFITDNPNITDEAFKYLTKLTFLFLCNCPNITNEGIKHLKLEGFFRYKCPQITDEIIKHFGLVFLRDRIAVQIIFYNFYYKIR